MAPMIVNTSISVLQFIANLPLILHVPVFPVNPLKLSLYPSFSLDTWTLLYLTNFEFPLKSYRFILISYIPWRVISCSAWFPLNKKTVLLNYYFGRKNLQTELFKVQTTQVWKICKHILVPHREGPGVRRSKPPLNTTME